MKIETKFSIGDKVITITKTHKEEFIPCKLCNATGVIHIGEESRQCPDCWGRTGRTEWKGLEWVSDQFLKTIGSVYVRIYKKSMESKNEYIYMLNETGIESGTLWPEKHLFLSLDEANAECAKINAEEAVESGK